MQSSLYLHAAYHHVLPLRDEKLLPRARYVEYQTDLHRIAGEVLDPLTLETGDQYTYTELADTLLERVGAEVLPHLDVLVTSYWTPEYDPEFSAFGPYLHHRWSLACQSFDVTDQGSIAPALALSVLKDYLSADGSASEGLLLAVEQTTMPQALEAHVPAPQRSSAGVVRASLNPEHSRAELLAAAYLSEAAVMAPDFRLQHLAAELCTASRCTPDEVTLVIRRNTYLYRAYQYWASIEPGSRITDAISGAAALVHESLLLAAPPAARYIGRR